MRFSVFRKIRIIFFDIFRVALVVSCLYFNSLLTYGIRMAKGEMNIVWNARNVKDVLADENVSDSIKSKLKLIEEIREFAFDEIGLKQSENYTTFYDQHGQRLIYVVTACKPFALEANLWHFPMLGNVPYKGFFNVDKAKTEAKKLKSFGLDVDIGGASGWSTLGFFKDPILSQMLNYKEGDLAELIIHELTHGTIFVKNDVEFNENLASFIGYKGALLFLEKKFGKNSKQYLDYVNGKKDDETLENFMLASAHSLDSLYKNFPKNCDNITKLKLKLEKFKTFVVNAKKLSLADDTLFYLRFQRRIEKSGNAFFMQYVRYGSKQHDFESDFEKYDCDLKKYVAAMKEKYLK